jgi:pimeloyl-ACP methyl ester carboxylesterase
VFSSGFDHHRHHIRTPSADLSYVEVGVGPAALFVHGIGTSAYLWADLVAGLADVRRCLVVDLPVHGQSPARPNQRMTIGAFADALAEFCKSLHLGEVDLVAHDTGGAVAQVFAARHPELLTSLALTNCDTADNLPPAAFAPTVELARAGQIVPAAPGLLADLAAARTALFAPGYENPEYLSIDLTEAFLQPVLGTPAAAEKFQELIASLEPTDLLAAESSLRKLDVPAVMVWGTADDFFDVKWAYWLRDLLPGAKEVVEVDGAKLFFPHERAHELAAHLRDFWSRNNPGA